MTAKSHIVHPNRRPPVTRVAGPFLVLALTAYVLLPAVALCANDATPSVVYQNLTELFARKTYGNAKPASLLYNTTTRSIEPELCIFRDAEYGTEIWRLANDPDATQHHCHINRSPWNSNGSKMGFMTYRYIPGFYYGPGDFRLLMITADADSQRVVVPQGHAGVVSYINQVNWDRFDPNVMWFGYFDGLYRTDVGSGDATTLFQALPNTDRRKGIFSYQSEQDQIMVKEANSESYTPNLYFIDPTKPAGSRLIYYPINFGITGISCHSQTQESSIHDIYFRRNADTTYVLNYGSATDVGEYCFFEVPYSGDKSRIELCYSQSSSTVPYYSHPAWNHDGTKVAYIGESSPGANDWGIQVRLHDAGTKLVTLTRQATSGHLAWDGYDDEWIAASTDVWQGSQKKLLKMNTVNATCVPFVNPYSGINGTSTTYCTLPRPAQSPDGTKILYTSTMLQINDSKPEIYVAVLRRPYPPRSLSASGSAGAGVTLTWQASSVCRETKGYHVYRSVGSDATFVELTASALNATTYTDNSAAAGQTYYYGVTTEEFSGLESDEMSNIVKVDVTQSGVSTGLHRAQGLKGWDTTVPAQVSGVSVQQVAPGQFRLNWQASPDTDVRYYNVYYSVAGIPSPSPQRLIASAPANTLTYLDWLARTDAAPYYAVTAVDRAGNESAPSSPSGSTDQTPPAAVRDFKSP